MDRQTFKQKIATIKTKRQYLVQLLERPNLGSLRLDVNQALEELDDLITECDRTFRND